MEKMQHILGYMFKGALDKYNILISFYIYK